jgi:hypothetical protein
MKFLALLFILFMTTTAIKTLQAAEQVRLVHYNIRELDSVKLNQGLADPQIQALREIFARFPFDLLSINEIQHDEPGIPSAQFTTTAKNLDRLLELIDAGAGQFSTFLAPANTGNNAIRRADGSYETDPNSPEGRALADPVNFGVFPGQYSTGAATRFIILDAKVVTNLRWKDFRPDRDLSPFRDARGLPLDPESIQLFDKNFTDLTLLVGGRKLHFILFHAVPSHHFGNPQSMNEARNHDQLAFLEWYVTGGTSFPVMNDLIETGSDGQTTLIKPLASDESFILVGDLNVDVTDPVKLGAAVIRRLYTSTRPWISTPGIRTFHGSSYAPNGYQGQLDYIFSSKDLRIINAGIHSPLANQVELGCGASLPGPTSISPGREVASYRLGDETCWVEVDRAYAQSKTASDHRLIWADFYF